MLELLRASRIMMCKSLAHYEVFLLLLAKA